MVIMESHNFLIFYGKHRNSLLKTILIFSLIENLVQSTTKQIKNIRYYPIEILYYPNIGVIVWFIIWLKMRFLSD